MKNPFENSHRQQKNFAKIICEALDIFVVIIWGGINFCIYKLIDSKWNHEKAKIVLIHQEVFPFYLKTANFVKDALIFAFNEKDHLFLFSFKKLLVKSGKTYQEKSDEDRSIRTCYRTLYEYKILLSTFEITAIIPKMILSTKDGIILVEDRGINRIGIVPILRQFEYLQADDKHLHAFKLLLDFIYGKAYGFPRQELPYPKIVDYFKKMAGNLIPQLFLKIQEESDKFSSENIQDIIS